MFDFLRISTFRSKGTIEIYPEFVVKKSKDLMIRGSDFYAVWLDDKKIWSTNEDDVTEAVDIELDKFKKENASKFDGPVKVLYMCRSRSGSIDQFHKYCKQQMRDNYHDLDKNIIFANQETKREDYASKKLSYSLEEGPIDAYTALMSTLYSEDERHKIEWGIGAIVAGDSKSIEKFFVLYGPPGSGKSTVLKIIQELFEGYTSVFDAASLGSSNAAFALEQFKSNPLVAICHDGDLSHIEDNVRINSLVSHETMNVNEKHKSQYSMTFISFLFIGTNKPVKITDAQSGAIRRLIDIQPTGNKIDKSDYLKLMNKIKFELGHIAAYCKQVYLEDKNAYDTYRPLLMMDETNDFYNFIYDNSIVFREEDGISLKSAWEMYKTYCEDAKVKYPFAMRAFKAELKNYFEDYKERVQIKDNWIRSYYSGFKENLLENNVKEPVKKIDKSGDEAYEFKEQDSNLDIYCSDCKAQYGTDAGTPKQKWENVSKKLKDIDTHKLHYLKVPENLIVIDLDLKDENGNKSFDLNLKESKKFPKTYAELSKSGGGIHLHYIYSGDIKKLSRVYSDDVEIKIFNGNSSLRRKLTKCNNEQIATISSGLPLKGESNGDNTIDFKVAANEKALRTIIKRNLNKEYHSATKPSMDFIYKAVEDAYKSGMKYDIHDLNGIILAFASSSTHHSDYCVDLVSKMHFASDEPSKAVSSDDKPLVFFDIEIFKNLFLVNWKFHGKLKSVQRMINPSMAEIQKLITSYRLIGFNNRKYDNHMLYARLMGYDNLKLYKLSKQIIDKHTGFFGEAYNISYTDIYDYSSNKQSLKKWEIELGIHHQELGLDWDKEVPEEMWAMVSEYCDNDVISTEAVWDNTQEDFKAREILADIAGMTVNDTTNSLTARIIFGNDRHPELVYTDLSKTFPGYNFVKEWCDKTQKYTLRNEYRGIDLGFGGYAIGKPGIYYNVALLDVESMHPHSIIAMNTFGKYTKRYQDIVEIRLCIKHNDFDKAKTLFDGKLCKYIDNPGDASALSKALKIPINAVYGLTSAKFDNPFRDKRNENNIVALRGALFIKTLADEVTKRGFTVAHIKTDSIKIPEATPEIISYCMDFAHKYGYNFEHEATYDRMCLVNDAVYIAKYKSEEQCQKMYGYVPKDNKKESGKWTATGAQFAVPYIFKKCFSKEEIIFKDLCEAKAVTSAMYLDLSSEDDIKNNKPNLKFIGKVGLFCPVVKDCGGGKLVREAKAKDGSTKYDSVTGTVGYLWMESEDVQKEHKEDCIDMKYFTALYDQTVDAVNKYGDYDSFVDSKEHSMSLCDIQDDPLPECFN